MAVSKTKPTEISAEVFIAAVSDPVRRADAVILCEMMARLSGESPVMWGPSIVGFGTRHYRYDSRREGDICRIGFSPRTGSQVLYIAGVPEAMFERLGKHKRGAGCLYVTKLADVDLTVLEEIVAASWAGEGHQRPA